MHAIILAGGFGTRLKPILAKGVPKAMASIQTKPFLSYLFHDLLLHGLQSITLSLHYQADTIQRYFGSDFEGLKINYLIEPEPLGTGGALAATLQSFDFPDSVFVLNGDTFANLNYFAMYRSHKNSKRRVTIALSHVPDCSRYAKIQVDNQIISNYEEKGIRGPGWVSNGVYLLDPTLFSEFELPPRFSFESEFLAAKTTEINAGVFISSHQFIDIGIAEDYLRAQSEIPANLLMAGLCQMG